MKQQCKKKYKIKDYIIALFIIIAFVFAVLCILKYSSSSTPVAEYETVWNTLQNNGYYPQDFTSDNSYARNITVNAEQLHFEFNTFQNDAAANAYWSEIHSDIISKEYYPDKGYYTVKGNYVIYSTTVNNVNYVGIRVGNTTVFAYSDGEHQNELNNILMSIGYLSPAQLGKTLNPRSKSIISILLYLIVLLPLSLLSTKHMRTSIFNSAKISCDEAKALRMESKNVFSYKLRLCGIIARSNKKTKKLMAVYTLMYLPVILLIITETVGMFRNEHTLFTDVLGIIAIIIILVNFSLKSNSSKK